MYVCVCKLEYLWGDVQRHSRWLSYSNVSSHRTTHTRHSSLYLTPTPSLTLHVSIALMRYLAKPAK